jgi:hypothetical protein
MVWHNRQEILGGLSWHMGESERENESREAVTKLPKKTVAGRRELVGLEIM